MSQLRSVHERYWMDMPDTGNNNFVAIWHDRTRIRSFLQIKKGAPEIQYTTDFILNSRVFCVSIYD